MGKYLLNRLMWIIPALWFISSAVFILIKLIPGKAAFLLEEDIGVNMASRSAIYRQYLEKTGQHLPLFYFSIRSVAEPEYVYSIKSDPEQQFLKRLALEYRNESLIYVFYTQVKNLQNLSNQLSHSSLRLQYQKQIAKIFDATNENSLNQALSALKQSNQASHVTPTLSAAVDTLFNSFVDLQKNSVSYKKYIPTVIWHGSNSQYHQWLVTIIKGDLGISLRDARPVHHILAEAIGNTLLVSTGSLLVTFIIVVLLNFLVIHEDYQWLGKPIFRLLYILDTIPVFLLALLFLILLASNQYLLWFPVYGLGILPEDATWLEWLSIRLHHLAIPMACLTLSTIPYISSQLYAAMKEVKQAEYIQTARAKGVPEWKIVKKHIFRNSVLPLITLFSGYIPALLGGAVVIEVIFAIPGMGRLLVDSVQARDYPVILGIVLVMAVAKMVAHTIADILYYLADPRIRFS